MEKVQFDCKEYILYSPDSLKYITDIMIKTLSLKIEEYKELFNIKDIEKFQINYFDDIEKFRNFIYEIRGEEKSLPMYAQGTYDKGMVNAFIHPNIIVGTPLYYSKVCTAAHELFHILYMKYILNYDYSKRIVWYDEGMAQFLCGQKDYLDSDEKFKEYYLSVRKNTKEVPNLNELDHGNKFKNENYDAYDLSYLCIKYLNETLTENEFKNLVSNFEKIKEYEEKIITDMFNYYDNKILENKKSK